jgi:hypothetical protein
MCFGSLHIEPCVRVCIIKDEFIREGPEGYPLGGYPSAEGLTQRVRPRTTRRGSRETSRIPEGIRVGMTRQGSDL